MKRSLVTVSIFLLVAAICHAQSVTVRVLPHRWSMNTKGKGRVKAEILNVDTKTIDTSSILMNGIAPLKTKSNTHKVIAFFSKRDVLGTLGTLQPGQTVTIFVTFGSTNGPSSLTDDVKIVKGKKSNKAPTPGGKP